MSTTTTKVASHTLSALVANRPGVLARIAQVIARRGFNIESLVVSPSNDHKYSRLTMTVAGDTFSLDQIIRQTNKLVDVIHCIDHTGQDAVIKELAMIKIEVDAQRRGEALEIAEHFKAHSADLTPSSMIFVAQGCPAAVDAFINMMNVFPIKELVRTGRVVMMRGAEAT